MTPNHRKLLELCIENGLKRGFMRAHKHTDKPDERVITEAVERAIWEELDEWFNWEAGVQ
jgi:hypothetical protein